jgi:hypothetical protein
MTSFEFREAWLLSPLVSFSSAQLGKSLDRTFELTTTVSRTLLLLESTCSNKRRKEAVSNSYHSGGDRLGNG